MSGRPEVSVGRRRSSSRPRHRDRSSLTCAGTLHRAAPQGVSRLLTHFFVANFNSEILILDFFLGHSPKAIFSGWNDRDQVRQTTKRFVGLFLRKQPMGRPRASSTILDFAARFATTVTVPSAGQYDWIARTGNHSTFTLLYKLAPKVRIYK